MNYFETGCNYMRSAVDLLYFGVVNKPFPKKRQQSSSESKEKNTENLTQKIAEAIFIPIKIVQKGVSYIPTERGMAVILGFGAVAGSMQMAFPEVIKPLLNRVTPFLKNTFINNKYAQTAYKAMAVYVVLAYALRFVGRYFNEQFRADKAEAQEIAQAERERVEKANFNEKLKDVALLLKEVKKLAREKNIDFD